MYNGFLGGLVKRYGWRKFQIGCWVLAAFGVLLMMPLMVFPGLAGTFLSGALAFSGVITFVFGIINTIITPNRRRRYTVFDAALLDPSSEEVPLVVEQPDPNIAALEPPADIDTVTRKPIAYLAVILTFVIFLGLFIVWHNAFALFLLLLVAGSMVANFVDDRRVVSVLAFGNQRIRIGEEGIVIGTDHTKLQVIAWDNVRVFALTQGQDDSQLTKHYMLSSGEGEVSWLHRPRTHWYSFTAPTTSDEEYQRQMEALLSYIAARTGLPLLDLR